MDENEEEEEEEEWGGVLETPSAPAESTTGSLLALQRWGWTHKPLALHFKTDA